MEDERNASDFTVLDGMVAYHDPDVDSGSGWFVVSSEAAEGEWLALYIEDYSQWCAAWPGRNATAEEVARLTSDAPEEASAMATPAPTNPRWIGRPDVLHDGAQAYGEVAITAKGEREVTMYCAVGVRDQDVEECKASRGDWWPYLSAWITDYGDREDVSDDDVATVMAELSRGAIQRLLDAAAM